MIPAMIIVVGIPAGVVNMVFGVGPKVGEAIVTHSDIPLLTFTGSSATGQRIQRNSAEFCKKLSLEVKYLTKGHRVIRAQGHS